MKAKKIANVGEDYIRPISLYYTFVGIENFYILNSDAVSANFHFDESYDFERERFYNYFGRSTWGMSYSDIQKLSINELVER